ncbi:HSP20-like chaperone [Lipomyces japonicus]|uniref:HSP20-like chaperone n=1 Tax=Lipomyces japonicus TaxID=56871 RepID=UPI0034CE6EA6
MPTFYASYNPAWSLLGSLAQEELAAKVEKKRALIHKRVKHVPSFAPLLDVYELPESYLVHVSLPGAAANSISVDFDVGANTLLLEGEIKSPAAASAETARVRLQERQTGRYERRIRLPDVPRIASEGITAKYTNGVLEVRISKAATPVRRAVRVEIEEPIVTDDASEQAAQNDFITAEPFVEQPGEPSEPSDQHQQQTPEIHKVTLEDDYEDGNESVISDSHSVRSINSDTT